MLKTAKKIICALLVACFVIMLLVSCSDKNATDTLTDNNGDNVNTNDTVNMSGSFKIIYEKSASKAANKLRKAIYNVCGVTPESTSDANAEPTANEIFLGDTGRAESTEYINSLESHAYGVRIISDTNGTKIFIGGKKSDYTSAALDIFLSDYLPTDNTSTFLQKTEDTVMINNDDKLKDEILAAQPVQWTGSNIFVQNGGYARLCQLPDEKLGCAYSGGGYIKFSTSADDGKTWSDPVNVIKIDKTPAGQTMTVANANIVVMKDGSYMMAFRAHTAGESYTSFYSSIRYCISTDGGATWSADKTVAENTYPGSKFTGFWEPHMIYIKDGRLAMYYASDCIGGDAKDYPFVKSMTYQHIIMHIYDEKTGTFGAPIVASNGEDHNSRDGMPVICKLSDGTYAMVIESSVMRGKYSFIIQMLFSEDGITWSEPKTVWTPSAEGNYSGAPYIVCLDDGRVAVSFQATEGSGSTIADSATHNSAMNVIISKKPVTYSDRNTVSKNSFERVFYNPIQTGTQNSYSVWPAMLVHDGKLYCIAECGQNNSKTSRTSKGLYIRIGELR